MTQAIPIPSQPYFFQASARYMRPEELSTYQTIEDLPFDLQAMGTVVVHIDFHGNVTHLQGPRAGTEGVKLGLTLQGEQHYPHEQVITESAYQLGATIERTNILKRIINGRVVIGGPGMNQYVYAMSSDRWFAGQQEDQPGWLGIFTRFTGWRWIQVWSLKTVDTAQKMDPTAYENNMAIWDFNWICPIPYYSKPAVHKTWKAVGSTLDKDGYYHGTIALANRGDIGTYVEYLVHGTGDCKVQDNQSSRMVQIPRIQASDGDVLVNTDPIHRTIIAENDPQDDLLHKILRASGILKFFLRGIPLPSGLPIWLRGYVRFMFQIPPANTVTGDTGIVHLRVAHTNPNAEITAIVSQRFRRSR